MVIAVNVRAACGAGGQNRLAQDKIKRRPDSAGDDDADHPEARAHAATGSVVADVADDEHGERGQRSPGKQKIEAQGKGQPAGVMAVRGNHDPEVVLDQRKGHEGAHHRPARNEL